MAPEQLGALRLGRRIGGRGMQSP
ncbi:MAG: hypothetical protein QOI30_2044, partial [Mycobacterium sp.]|nr:hypothetical protein [Mycobacterium sp.]MDT7769036.1 hypothetical protein [Mycobacterium sp.]